MLLYKGPKPMKTGGPGIYTRRLSVNISDITSHRRLLNYLKIYYRRHLTQLDFSPHTNMILSHVSSLSFVPCFLLAYSLCRINELGQISVPLIKSGSPFKIISSKGGTTRLVDPFRMYKKSTLAAVPNSTLLIVVSYDSLRSSIISCRNRNNIKLPPGVLDCTHIFRHLEASWMHHKGHDLEVISYKLGHKMEKTTLQYIHEGLFL